METLGTRKPLDQVLAGLHVPLTRYWFEGGIEVRKRLRKLTMTKWVKLKSYNNALKRIQLCRVLRIP